MSRRTTGDGERKEIREGHQNMKDRRGRWWSLFEKAEAKDFLSNVIEPDFFIVFRILPLPFRLPCSISRNI
jgi:hypothetical protein